MTLKFVPLPEVNGIFEWGTGSVVRVFIHFSVLLGDFWVLVAGLRGCFDVFEHCLLVGAIFVLKTST